MKIDRRSFFVAAASAGALALPAARALAQPRPLAIDEGMFVDINGYEQWIVIRGQDLRNPVLLFLEGGPPGLGAGGLTPMFADWEKRFTVVQWDQPGSGATGIRNAQAPGTLSIERYIKDGLAVAEYARARLGARKMVVMGVSFGTLLGLSMVRRRPDLFSAYVGASQAIDGPEGGRIGYELGLKAARERGDAAAVAALEKVGPPPYKTAEEFFVRQQYTNPPGLPASPAEKAASAELAKVLGQPHPQGARWVANQAPPPGYDPVKQFLAIQRAMFQETAAWRASSLGLNWPVPILVIQGENDLNTPTSLARDSVARIKAPSKHFEVIPAAGHGVGYTFNDQLLLALVERHVRPLVV